MGSETSAILRGDIWSKCHKQPLPVLNYSHSPLHFPIFAKERSISYKCIILNKKKRLCKKLLVIELLGYFRFIRVLLTTSYTFNNLITE